ncbi:hypothetical protein [Brevundimonas sp.]|uniref:hypothetical protein n=1 Tax=Brevundimonas sp. TaxID=1871086 RepID=UPI003F6E45A8
MVVSVALMVAVLAQDPKPPTTPESTSPVGAWQASDETAPLDGRRTVTRTLLSTNQVTDSTGRPVPGILMLKCQGRSIIVYVTWPGAYFGTHLNDVSWRVDGSAIRSEGWEAPYGMPNVTSEDNPRRLLDAIAGGQQLVMRVSSYNVAHDFTFDLGDGAEAVGAVREACVRR